MAGGRAGGRLPPIFGMCLPCTIKGHCNRKVTQSPALRRLVFQKKWSLCLLQCAKTHGMTRQIKMIKSSEELSLAGVGGGLGQLSQDLKGKELDTC